MRPEIDLEWLRGILSYDSRTGEFRWLKNLNPLARKGDIAGNIKRKGNNQKAAITIGILGHRFMAHRIAWLMTYGKLPNGQIDHINGNALDNRICNLRDVSGSLNQQNRRKPNSNNKSGFLGVCWNHKEGKFIAQIRAGTGSRRIGTSSSAEEAHSMYLEAKRKLHKGCTI